MSRNYGWGQRDMQDAGRIALQASGASFESVATHTQRFGEFRDFCKENGIGRMERVTPELVREYGQIQADRVDAGEISPAYAQNLVSSVNSVMKAATRNEWRSVSPTKECNIPARNNVRTTPTVGRENAERGVQALREQGLERQAAMVALARDLGLRAKEASLFDAKTALQQAENQGKISITDGTKGGRERELTIQNERQLETLRTAAAVQGDGRGVMPADKNWVQWQRGGLKEGREALQNAVGCRGYHELRAEYACQRYGALTGNVSPCNGGTITDRQADLEARQTIAEELGHGRVDVLVSYIGGRG